MRRASSAKAKGDVRRIELRGKLDRHAVEALHLEVRRLARRYGIEITAFRATAEGRSARRAGRAPSRPA